MDFSGRILEKLERLRARDADLRVFGADDHRYQLGPCLELRELVELEGRYGVELPADYRRFLLEVGNGGAGPGFGLQRFGLVDADGTCIPQIAHLADPLRGHYWNTCIRLAVRGRDAVRRPFPLSKPLLSKDVYEDEGNVESLDQALKKLVLADGTNTLEHGHWELVQYGCGIGAVLVLTGKERGHVWIDDLANSGAFVDCANWVRLSEPDAKVLPRDATFVGWYEHWLDASLEEASAPSSRPSMPPREPKLEPDPMHQLRDALAEAEEAARRAMEWQAREERRAEAEARRARERPALEVASKPILRSFKKPKDGMRLDGKCPKCGNQTSLRVCYKKIVLCMPCYFAF